MGYISNLTGGQFAYDARIFDSDWNKINSPYVEMLQNSTLRENLYAQIHIDQSTKTPKFEESSDAVDKAYELDNMINYADYVDFMIFIQYPVVIVAGEFDVQDGITGQYTWMKSLLASLDSTFWEQDRKIYYFNGTKPSDSLVGGYYIKA